MDTPSEHADIPLRQQSSTLSDVSIGSNSTFVASPASPSIRRPGYHRVPSVVEEGAELSTDRLPKSPSDGGSGLGISNLASQRRSSVSRVPVGSKTSDKTPGSADPLISPPSTGPMNTHRDWQSPENKEGSGASYDLAVPEPYQSFTVDSERERLYRNALPGGASNKELLCQSRKPLGAGRSSWLAISILILSAYSTCFSASWLLIALTKPRYGRTITTAGKITPQTATILCTAFARTIELSFVTVFVALIGQVLSKRALGNHRSITIAEMSMRSWILQPGTMIAHWESVRYAGATYLGAIALVMALMAMVYTTASDALVSPKLKMGELEHRVLYGKVATSFANTYSVMDRCTTPIQKRDDPDNAGQTCISIEHPGEAYHNYMQYLGTWVDSIDVGNGSIDINQRPVPVGVSFFMYLGSANHYIRLTSLQSDAVRQYNCDRNLGRNSEHDRSLEEMEQDCEQHYHDYASFWCCCRSERFA